MRVGGVVEKTALKKTIFKVIKRGQTRPKIGKSQVL